MVMVSRMLSRDFCQHRNTLTLLTFASPRTAAAPENAVFRQQAFRTRYPNRYAYIRRGILIIVINIVIVIMIIIIYSSSVNFSDDFNSR